MAIRGLLFDFDGLLVDTETPSRLAWRSCTATHGHELPQDQWATLVGTIGAPFDPFGHLEELVGRRLDEEALDTRRRAREDELAELEELRPGVEDYFAEAERLGLRTAVVSSSDDGGSRGTSAGSAGSRASTRSWPQTATQSVRSRGRICTSRRSTARPRAERGDRLRGFAERRSRGQGRGPRLRRGPEPDHSRRSPSTRPTSCSNRSRTFR